MAPKMQSFSTAAREAEGETPFMLFTIDDEEYRAAKPTTGQVALVVSAMADDDDVSGASQLSAIFKFLRGVIKDGDGFGSWSTIKRGIESGDIPFSVIIGGDEYNEKGIIDSIIEWAGGDEEERPTKRSAGSSTSRAASGPRSTGRSPGKGSIHSATASRAS